MRDECSCDGGLGSKFETSIIQEMWQAVEMVSHLQSNAYFPGMEVFGGLECLTIFLSSVDTCWTNGNL